jgi:hypothetical protein
MRVKSEENNKEVKDDKKVKDEEEAPIEEKSGTQTAEPNTDKDTK